jgi:hypothetical protein
MAGVHLFGIRHHGPGSARSLMQALEALRPDLLLIEGPPDATALLPLAAHAAMRPPVALLVYAPEQTQKAAFYPFADFSPEWQAIQYAWRQKIAVRFIDLPQAHQLMLRPGERDDADADTDDEADTAAPPAAGPDFREDPLAWLGAAAGYSDGERWWEHMVEQRRDTTDLFAAILEAMTALRHDLGGNGLELEAQREAYRRQCVRAAEREGFERIAVVCGAWHAPALADMPSAKHDATLLKGLPKIKVSATWIPWTNGRLSYASGYGAGIRSPGWYAHLWESQEQITTRWLTKVAHLLREQDLDASPANVIEAVRLAETLCALRGRALPGLPELMEATQAVLCGGADLPLRLIGQKLIVGEALGQVPEAAPQVPLHHDLRREQKRLRLAPDASVRDLDFDLRQPNDLARSHLLHRLLLLDLHWGMPLPAPNRPSTFHELWRLQWQPEFAVALVEASRYGSTVAEAAASRARELALAAPGLPVLTQLLNQVLLAGLPDAAQAVIERVQAEAALSSDVGLLMEALPPLANLARYGSVRQLEAGPLDRIVAGLLARICIGLPGACASLDDEAAAAMFERLVQVHGALRLLPDEARGAWIDTLAALTDQAGVHGLLAGRCCRLLLEHGHFSAEEAARRLGLALAPANEPAQAAAWVEGLLRGSGLLLLHDDSLWGLVDTWLAGLTLERFTLVLPLLRRTFASFTAPERRQMGERARRGHIRPAARAEAYHAARVEAVVPALARLLGVDEEQKADVNG